MATSLDPASSVSASAASSLSMQDLLRVMLTELTYQNPLKPVENKDFMTQIAQFSSLDASQRLNQNLEKLLSLQSINQSVGLLGKTVDVQTATGAATGQVTALSLASGDPQITITTTAGDVLAGITIGQIETVR
jgi:flagellar basal-body rod modification protein FlgD